MIKYLINAISKGLAFSKNEARGTVALAILIIVVVIFSNFTAARIKNKSPEIYDPALLAAWVAEVDSSYSAKKISKPKPKYKSTYDFPKPVADTKAPLITQPPKVEKLVVLDLNNASLEELQEVKGIGKVYSERIIKYREMLGGFSAMSQLAEVYGVEQDLVEKVSLQFSIQSQNQAIVINSDSVKTLVKHPYISYDLAWVIINYRKQNGDIDGFQELKKIKAIDDSLLIKLRPYIK